MDSEVQRDGRILDLIDDAWREDKLPYEDVAIPLVGRDNESEVYCGEALWMLLEGEMPGPRNPCCGIF